MYPALASDALRNMIDKIAHEVAEAITDIEGKMVKLKELSKSIDKVIQDLDSCPFIYDATKDLLKKLKYMAYDLEDVVDSYDTKVLQKQQRSNTYFGLVREFFSSDNPVVFKIRVGFRIKAITESLESILLQESILLNLPQGSIHMAEPSLYRMTHSARNSYSVIGREPEKNKIVNMLTYDDGDESSHGSVKVIVIVGKGGLGKTTLAQLVFNDKRVKTHFESSMWTVVGAEFDPAKIMKSILELATDAPVNISQIDLVRQNLEKALARKKFLLVLDDVWNEDPFEWGKLKATLTCGRRGSKILVTTRSQHVSSIVGSSNTTHQIHKLSRDDCLSLFQQFAFGNQAVDQNLMEIGEEIVEKCGGVPLAAISLGSMLRGTRDVTYWSVVLKSEIWQLRDEQKMLAVLKLSYETLPLQSKKCFAFASLFSKNYRIAKDELIKLWIANGFVCSEGNFDAETIGNHIFNDLVMGSLFLLAPVDVVTECSMDDLMHDLARSLSADVYWNSNQDSVGDIGNRTYHLHMHTDFKNLSNIIQAPGKKPLYLRTLILNTFSLNADQLEFIFSELKLLRALDLRYNNIRKVPISIENLIHLRYLNLSWNDIEVLPDSITLLPNLQYLNLSFNKELQELPKELGNMQSLRGLDCRCHDLPSVFSKRDLRLTHIPCGLSLLTNLRSLSVFVAGDRIGACSITELEDLKLHGEMNIIFSENFTDYSCAGRKILKNKDLNELCVEFNRSESHDMDMLDDLCPNTSLKKLTICDYESRQFPAWLMESQLPNLVEVRLEKCRGCEHIPPFGNLQFLRKLNLCRMNGITQMGAEFHGRGGFPSLQELILNEMSNLEEWSESDDVDQLLPILQKLQISRCPKLKSMPRLARIQELKISCCSGSLLSCVGRLTCLYVLRVEDMNNMTSLPSGCFRNLTSLKELQIIQCTHLQSLPGDEIQHLKMIQSLDIDGCKNLASFPLEVVRLSSLCRLRLINCPSIIILQPEKFVQILNSVREFEIEICGKKINLRGQLHRLDRLSRLFITGEHDIYSDTQLGICCCDELESLMTAKPASSVLQHLEIRDISNLTSLPDWLQHLKFLRVLSIRNCSQLGMLPKGLKNLHMLESLRIINCPQLKRRCQRDTGEDWPSISHVPYVDM